MNSTNGNIITHKYNTHIDYNVWRALSSSELTLPSALPRCRRRIDALQLQEFWRQSFNVRNSKMAFLHTCIMLIEYNVHIAGSHQSFPYRCRRFTPLKIFSQEENPQTRTHTQQDLSCVTKNAWQRKIVGYERWSQKRWSTSNKIYAFVTFCMFGKKCFAEFTESDSARLSFLQLLSSRLWPHSEV